MLSSSSQACHLSSRKPQLSHDLKLVLLRSFFPVVLRPHGWQNHDVSLGLLC